MSTLETFLNEKFGHLTAPPLNKNPIRAAVCLARINAALGRVSRDTFQHHILAQAITNEWLNLNSNEPLPALV